MAAEMQRFYESEDQFQQIRRTLKLTACPHCRRIGTLNLHGCLYGYTDTSSTGRTSRGHRIFCNNRRCGVGCGRTFSVLPADILKGFTITAATVWRLMRAVAQRMSIAAALRSLNAAISYSNAGRLVRLFDRVQSRMRSLLMRYCPVSGSSSDSRPFVQTMTHLQAAFAESPCPVAAFQLRFQVSFF